MISLPIRTALSIDVAFQKCIRPLFNESVFLASWTSFCGLFIKNKPNFLMLNSDILLFFFNLSKAKEKYRGVFEIQKSGDKTSTGEIGLDIRTHASPKVGQVQVSGGVSVLCWHAAPVAYVLWKPCTIR